MRKERASKSSRPHGYVLPAQAHASLLRTRDHLQLLFRLTAARIAYDAAELELSQEALVPATWTRRSRRSVASAEQG